MLNMRYRSEGGRRCDEINQIPCCEVLHTSQYRRRHVNKGVSASNLAFERESSLLDI